ncbi:hypothetical protein [Vitiosangium sp. GDMCC 1.1324]|uniref:hypothetical protein n=1 Tax=Vitiosangium sp. (strain GDMCC 1.1324) TaxID=2138576 RepID=UPI000D39E310|nr:hypothetical protein [Vitiosangium sp. GDMCC 1.1324]PTL78528.1 hypothetical protein DAT35_39070 [Vitiosangium sp. GDMCC 1.1324]
MLPGNDKWPESIQALYEQVAGSLPDAVLSSRPQWTEQLAEWVRSATLDEREMAQGAAWARLDTGARSPGELLFLLVHCGELLWPYSEAPKELLLRLISRQEQLVQALKGEGQGEAVEPLVRQVEAELSKVVSRYLKRHPEELVTLVSGVRCTFDGRVLRFNETVEVDLKVLLGSEKRVIGRLDQLRTLLPYLREGRDKLVGFIRERAAKIPWRESRDILEEKLFQLVAASDSRSELRGFLGSYVQGKRETRWCNRASLLLARNLEEGGALAVIENLSELLAYFEAPVEGLRGALQALVASIHEDKDLERHRLVADKCWEHLKPEVEPGLALVLLWLEERIFRVALRQGSEDSFERRNRARERVRELPVAEALYWLSEECADLWPRFESEHRPGADDLAAWRQEVTRRFAKKPVLRKAGIEFFLWCAPDAAASEAELVTLSLVKTSTDRRLLRRLGEHPSTRVRFRVRAINAWLAAGPESAPEPQTPATLTGALRHLRASGAMTLGGGRTWLRDRDLEELLLGAFSRVERDFSARYPEHFREDEGRLITRLLEDLKHEFESIRSDLSILLSQGQPVPLELELQYRRTREPVEGEPAAENPRPAGVELAFVLKVEVDSFLTTKRAVLVQATKLERRGEGQWAPNIRLGREQVDGLLGQSESSFCLFLVPPSLRAECWMVPARLVRGLMDAQGSLSTVPREGAQRVARSLAQWMTYDLLGLWAGDDRPVVLERAEAGAERGPDFVVEISVRKTGR